MYLVPGDVFLTSSNCRVTSFLVVSNMLMSAQPPVSLVCIQYALVSSSSLFMGGGTALFFKSRSR